MKTSFNGSVQGSAWGTVISLAVAFGGASAFAEGLIPQHGAGAAGAIAGSGFPTARLEQLAVTDDGVTLTPSALVSTPSQPLPTRKLHSVSREEHTPDHDVFPILGQVLPLIVTRPQGHAIDVQLITAASRNLAQPVGVSGSSL